MGNCKLKVHTNILQTYLKYNPKNHQLKHKEELGKLLTVRNPRFWKSRKSFYIWLSGGRRHSLLPPARCNIDSDKISLVQ